MDDKELRSYEMILRVSSFGTEGSFVSRGQCWWGAVCQSQSSGD